MTEIKFLRHFQTQVQPGKPASDWPLSESGEENSKEFVENRLPWVDAVYTSTEEKAMRTARAAAEKLDVEMVKTDLLAEVDRSATGFIEDHDRYVEMVREYLSGRETRWEDREEVRERFRGFLEKVEEESDHDEVLAVTHGMFLSLNVPHGKNFEFWENLEFGELIGYVR
ncbi:MAG: histidine phosphatase family protein [Candidatus Nanohaloarchaea archaeon]